MENEKVIDRIQKLRRLAESQNVHEAAAAAGEAQRLMTEHRISEAQLQSESGDIDEPVTDTDVLAALGTKTPQSWLVRLASGIARANGCRITITSSRKGYAAGAIKMYGQPSRLSGATYLFYAMTNEINRLSDLWNSQQAGANRGATLSFKLGAAIEISERMREEQSKATAMLKQSADLGLAKSAGALMVIKRGEDAVQAAVDIATGGRRGGWSGSGPSNGGAFHAGRAAGRGVNLGNRGRLGKAPKMIGS